MDISDRLHSHALFNEFSLHFQTQLIPIETAQAQTRGTATSHTNLSNLIRNHFLQSIRRSVGGG